MWSRGVHDEVAGLWWPRLTNSSSAYMDALSSLCGWSGAGADLRTHGQGLKNPSFFVAKVRIMRQAGHTPCSNPNAGGCWREPHPGQCNLQRFWIAGTGMCVNIAEASRDATLALDHGARKLQIPGNYHPAVTQIRWGTWSARRPC